MDHEDSGDGENARGKRINLAKGVEAGSNQHPGQQKRGYRAYWRWFACHWQRFIAWTERRDGVIEAIAAVVIALFTAATWYTGNKQWEAIQKQIAVAEEANRLTQLNLELSARSWVVVKEIKNPTFVNEIPTETTLVAENVGHTPANQVTIVSRSKTAPNLDRVVFDYEDIDIADPPSESVLGAGHTQTQYISAPQRFENTYPFVMGGNALWVIYGRITYSDNFKKQRSCYFCAEYRPTKKLFVFCPIYNDCP